MKKISPAEFDSIIQRTRLKPKLKRDLKYVASTANLNDDDWRDRELLPVTDRTGTKGILLIQPYDLTYIVPYELSRGLTNQQTGRSNPVICDFCRTWQSGNNSASITFKRDLQTANSVTFLCCADLACSDHVRSKTTASLSSRAQLRENLTDAQRAERLKERLNDFVHEMKLKAIDEITV